MKSIHMMVATIIALCTVGDSHAEAGFRGTLEFEQRMLQSDEGRWCSKNVVCRAEGLDGACCPTVDGVYLDCCERRCYENLRCDGLQGDCCPTKEGDYLDCCRLNPEQRTWNQNLASCQRAPKCAAMGHQGNCCPTKQGRHLDCCS
ncbi:expressed unknown protein [Seminavis robusta]|uniref:Uncharacterized protein n=1 Tax=Seminavis robusta TaxID=568900 RepID=A0A9N8H7F7_9STRA|nr:expressed unknown protein [Seminavis robusta]|eukprot:Sro177_g077851.1  (146) ;mRNA; f:73412-73849